MALNIKDDATDRLARELAAATGESITEAARIALAERLARVRRRQALIVQTDELTEIVRRGRARPVLDERTTAEILGYDSNGLPT